MNLSEFKKMLDKTGFKVAYSHFNKPVEPPFITYIVDNNPNFIADNKVFYKIKDVTIELYTDKKDESVEKVLEDILDDHEIPYRPYEFFIESEKLYQKNYEVRLY